MFGLKSYHLWSEKQPCQKLRESHALFSVDRNTWVEHGAITWMFMMLSQQKLITSRDTGFGIKTETRALLRTINMNEFRQDFYVLLFQYEITL